MTKKPIPASLIGLARHCPMAAHLTLQGVKPGKASQAKIAAGIQSHDTLTDRIEARDAAQLDSRCYVATCVYGGAHPHTVALRAFRDTHLTGTVGRFFVAAYYQLSPTLVKVLGRSPRMIYLTRGLLSLFVWLLCKPKEPVWKR